MKKCKIIHIRNFNESPKLIDSPKLDVWACLTEEKIINEYLAQGYEINQIIKNGTDTTVYFVKDV